MDFKEVCARIRDLKIQGANNVAFAGLRGFSSFASKAKSGNREEFLKALEAGRKELFATRPTEPMMRNFILYAISRAKSCKSDKVADMKRAVRDTLKAISENFKADSEALENHASRLIVDGKNLFTHCHSSTVMGAFKRAYGFKKFSVYSTETRPLFQGRITAEELAKANIPAFHIVDSGAAHALSKCSAMFIGADAIVADGSVVNKIGSNMFAQAAASKNIPVYVCSHSWKYDPETAYAPEMIEERSPDEVWPNAPSKVKILNPAFDVIDKRHITAIVSELGVLWPADFVRQVKQSFYLRDSASRD